MLCFINFLSTVTHNEVRRVRPQGRLREARKISSSAEILRSSDNYFVFRVRFKGNCRAYARSLSALIKTNARTNLLLRLTSIRLDNFSFSRLCLLRICQWLTAFRSFSMMNKFLFFLFRLVLTTNNEKCKMWQRLRSVERKLQKGKQTALN